MSRIKARELAFKLIFSFEFDKDFIKDKLAIDFVDDDNSIRLNLDTESGIFEDNSVSTEEDKAYCDKMVSTFLSNRERIDELIVNNVVNYNQKRIYKCDLAILRLACAEMLMKEYDYPIIINSAVEIANKFSNDKSYKFIHSVLGKIVRELYDE